jgi:hypothetical protein
MCSLSQETSNVILASVAVGISCVGPWVENRAYSPILAVPLNTAPT